MKHIVEYLNNENNVIIERHNDDNTIKAAFNQLTNEIGNKEYKISITNLSVDSDIIKAIAGNVIEKLVRSFYKNFKSSLGEFSYPYKEDEDKIDNAYDFSWGGDKYKVKSFNSKPNNAKLTENQLKSCKETIYILVNYEISGDAIKINEDNIMLVYGENLKLNNNHIAAGNKSEF